MVSVFFAKPSWVEKFFSTALTSHRWLLSQFFEKFDFWFVVNCAGRRKYVTLCIAPKGSQPASMIIGFADIPMVEKFLENGFTSHCCLSSHVSVRLGSLLEPFWKGLRTYVTLRMEPKGSQPGSMIMGFFDNPSWAVKFFVICFTCHCCLSANVFSLLSDFLTEATWMGRRKYVYLLTAPKGSHPASITAGFFESPSREENFLEICF